MIAEQIIRDALLNLDCACADNVDKGRVCCLHGGLAALAELTAFRREWADRFGFLAEKNPRDSRASINEVADLINAASEYRYRGGRMQVINYMVRDGAIEQNYADDVVRLFD